MGTFSGFPGKSHFTPVPNVFFSELLPQISDLSELKVVLHLFRLLYEKKGFPKFISRAELLSSRSLMSGLKGFGKPPEEMLDEGLFLAEKRGIILRLPVVKANKKYELFLLNTERNKEAIASLEKGEINIGAAIGREEPPAATTDIPNIFSLYEENIAVLTPLIADELREAERIYPSEWIEDAFKDAVATNKRNWRYIARILERWAAEGKDGKFGRDSKKADDPSKYFTGKYGHVVRH